VAYLDREVDRLLDFLRSRGLLETTLVAFVADHGENLEDHGVLYRHAGLWDTTTHVPMSIRWPGERRQGRRLRGLVQTLDLYPTLLAAAGLRPNPQDGRDLRLLTGPGRGGRRAVFAEQADGHAGGTVRTRRYRLFEAAGSKLVPDGAYFYDLREDPGELANLAGRGLAEEAALRDLLRRWRRQGGARAPATRDAERDAELRALGYL
jgi:arylsulfatase A-like enzyme